MDCYRCGTSRKRRLEGKGRGAGGETVAVRCERAIQGERRKEVEKKAEQSSCGRSSEADWRYHLHRYETRVCAEVRVSG